MPGLVEFRTAVSDRIAAQLPTVPLWRVVPNDIAEVPCIVVVRPAARETSVTVVFDLTVDTYVIGRTVDAGGSDDELVALADDVWAAFLGTRGVRGDIPLEARSLEPRVVSIAGQDLPAYLIVIESSVATC